MTPGKILAVVKDAIDTFRNISEKPTDNDVSLMNQTILPILLKIPYNQIEATHNLSGLVSPSAKYIAKYGTAFQRPTRPKPYSPTITATMSNVKRRKAEAMHSSRK